MKKTKKGMSVGKEIAIGAGVVAIGAGAYYLLGPKAKEHQKKAKALLVKIKKEAESEMKKAKNTSASFYQKVDSISADYCKQYEAHEGEIKALAKKLKSEWKGASSTVKKTAKETVRSLKKR